MRIQGDIRSKETGELIPATVIALHPVDGSIATLAITPGEFWYLEGEENYLRELTVLFTSQGYASVKRTGGELISNGNIVLAKTNFLILIVAAGAMFWILRNKQKKVGKLETKDITPWLLIAGAALGFVLFKQLMEALGLWKDPDERRLDDLSKDANSFWNPNFWSTKPTGTNYTNPITLSTAKQYAGEIYNSFNALNDCEECVKGVFRRIASQASASYIAYAFNITYGKDLLDFLRGGVWPQDRLSDKDVNEITNYVLTLPKY